MMAGRDLNHLIETSSQLIKSNNIYRTFYKGLLFLFIIIGFPPAEKSSVTRQFFGNTNFFGGPFDHTVKVIC